MVCPAMIIFNPHYVKPFGLMKFMALSAPSPKVKYLSLSPPQIIGEGDLRLPTHLLSRNRERRLARIRDQWRRR